MLKATIEGLEAADAMGNPSNLDILVNLHRAYREWATDSPLGSQFRNARLRETITYGQLGAFTHVERGGCDGMLCVAPIGLAFTDDPGRAFEIGAKAAALSDADFNSGLAAGVISLLFALMEQGIGIRDAIVDILSFIRPLDWCQDVSNALRSVLDGDALAVGHSPACSDLRVGLSSCITLASADGMFASALSSSPSWNAATLAGQLRESGPNGWDRISRQISGQQAARSTL